MAAEGEFPKVDGDVLYASEVNLFKREQMEVYAGTGFDSSQSGAGTDTDNHEFTAISAANLLGADYLEITITYVTTNNTDNDSYLQIQTKEIGGAYGDTFPSTLINENGVANSMVHVLRWVHTLTAGEKTNGVQVNIISTSTVASAYIASVTNKQTVIKPI